MSHVRSRLFSAPTAALFMIAAGLVVGSATLLMARQPGAVAEGPGAAQALPKVPPLPEGTPQEMMQFIANLKQANVRPTSRKEMIAYMRDVAIVSLQAADKILAQVKPADPLHDPAAKMKLESLMMLGRFGDEKAAADMATYAATLINSPSKDLAKEAQRLVVVSEAQQILSSGDAKAAEGLVQKTTAMLAADPDDIQTAGLAMQLAGAFEHMPGGEAVAAAAYRSFGPAMAKSSNEQIQKMGESFAGTLRRLSLPGHPMEIRGTLLNGKPFDQKSLAGKVVLVDFWATWCGPCRMVAPVLEEIATEKSGQLTVAKLDVDANPATARDYQVVSIPTLILFKDGKPVKRVVGAKGKAALLREISDVL